MRPLIRCLLPTIALLSTTPALRADPAVWKDVTPRGLSAASTGLVGVDYGNGTFVAVGIYSDPATGQGHDVSFTSQDGSTWTEHTLDFAAGGRVRFAHGKFYLFGSAPTKRIFSSADGASWTSVDDAESENFAVGVVEGNGVTVAARGSGLSGIEAAVLTDEGHWTGYHLPVTSPFTALTGIAFGAGKFAAVGAGIQGPFYFTSPDGQTWTAQPGLDYGHGFSFITYGNGTFLAQENGASQHVSTDGLTWTVPNPGYVGFIPGFGPLNQALRYARFLNGQFVAVTVNDGVATSPDAKTWTELATVPSNGTTDRLKDIVFGGGHYVTVGDKHIYADAAGGTTPPVVKTADLSVEFSGVKVGPNAKGTKTKFKGTLTVTNSGKKPANDVQVAAYLSDDRTFSAAGDKFVSLLSLSDLGFPTLAKKGGTTGALAAKFVAKTGALGTTSGKYLLVVADPQNAINDGDRSNNVFACGPLP